MSSLKVEVEAKVSPTAKVEQPIPILANSIPIGGSKGQVLTKQSGKPYDVAWENPKGGEGGGDIIVEGVTEEQVKVIVQETLPDWVEQPEKPTYTYEEITEKPDLVEDIGSSLAEETNVLTIELKDKSGKVIASTEVTIPKGEVPDLTDYVKYNSYGTNEKGGTLRGVATFGFEIDQYGRGKIVKASNAEIDAKSNEYKPIVPKTLEYAVMKALSDCQLEWTDEQKANARKLLGIE